MKNNDNNYGVITRDIKVHNNVIQEQYELYIAHVRIT